ncbi:MAG: M16 family metallopeptidase [Blastocatellia bacterium]
MKTKIMKKMKWQASLALTLIAAFWLALSTVAANPGAAPQTAGQSTKKTPPKGKAPVSQEVLKVKLPRAKEATLKNGLRVIALEGFNQAPTFTMQMVVLSGGLSDPPNHRGLAGGAAALLREGTSARASREIADQIDSLGATLQAGSDQSSFTTTVTISGLARNLDPALDLFADVIRRPKFPPDEVEKYKARIISQLQLQRSIPRFLAQERFSRALYGDHPAGIVASPVESLKKTASEDLARFHAANYLPNNSILAVVGDVTLKELLPKLERVFGDWKSGEAPKTVIPPAPAQGAAKIHLIDRPGSVQTVIQLGNLGIERADPDYFALLVMDKIVGGGPAARLFLNLREEKGYTYGAYSSFNSSKFRGAWQASAEVRTNVTEGAMKEFMYELKRIRDEKVSTAELDNAKRALTGGFALSLEQPQTLLQNIITQKLYNLPADYWDTYPQKVAAVTAEDAQRVAQKYVDLAHLQIVAVGDASKIREALQKYGSVEVYDPEGKPVKDAAGK